jgi:hypothetical protein
LVYHFRAKIWILLEEACGKEKIAKELTKMNERTKERWDKQHKEKIKQYK